MPAPLKEPLVYRIPELLQDRIVPGIRVLVPLQKRTITGVVLESVAENMFDRAKAIIALLDEEPFFDIHLLKLANWISQYYLASLGEVIAAMLPPSSRPLTQALVILRQPEATVRGDLDHKILHELGQHKGKLSLRQLKRKLPETTLRMALARLQSRGIIQIEDQLPRQRAKAQKFSSSADCQAPATPDNFRLTSEQQVALSAVETRLQLGGFETFLLHGVTGSGKTEVYLRAMERVRALGRKSLILIPEIALTPQLLDRLSSRFPGKIGVLHSGLTAAERWAQYRQIAHGSIDVVVGARSAVFAPIPDLGLIVVDEEHDSSYKQEEGLRYNGRDIAVVRAKLLSCPVILGSATPALESYENCRQGRYRLLEITQRVEARPLPRIELIDLRRRFDSKNTNSNNQGSAMDSRDPNHQLLSPVFAKALQENLQAGHQTLIFLNRRGFANFVQCTLCGHVWRCPYCSVTLTLHLKLKTISCHHCDYRRPLTDICPQCHNATLTGVGSGTERIEQAIQQLAPQAKVARMDRDTTHRRGSHEELIRRWERGEIDVLVGTQMITKGHDVSGVTLVGALLADMSLNMPDFRAAERTFQLLSQVAGRSGRGDNRGVVMIQTYAPEHYAIQYLAAHDYQGFFKAESEFRRTLNYPPFSRLVNLRIDGPKLAEVEQKARSLALQLHEIQSHNREFHSHIDILGPAPAPIEKLRNRYRWQLLLRSKRSSTLLKFARAATELLPNSRTVRLHIDVDPYSML